MAREFVTIDGNEAAAHIAHKTNEVCAIYPITPSSTMGEWADEWSSKGMTNIWGTVPAVQEMQSEGGAAAAVHGALQTGALTTTFTASQGLLLMIPTMFKIAGELTSTVFHVTARCIATHALSIFGDHSDINACRTTGWAMLASGCVQEVGDMALIAQASTLEARVPFIHFFDGFRTSHEIQKVERLSDDDIRAMISDELVLAHRARALNPDKPLLRGTAQNPDTFFQSREGCNKYYDAVPGIVQKQMDKFAKIVGRQYHLFDYCGAPDADRVIVLMGSGAEAAEEAVHKLNSMGEKVGLVRVRLYRPFAVRAFVESLPKTVKKIAVLDRTKEPGAVGEPLYLDCVTAIEEAYAEGYAKFDMRPRLVGGRYGLSSKEFTPAMVKGVLDNLKLDNPKHHFSIGIDDDVTHLSLDYDPSFTTDDGSTFCGLFFGLGSDGTVGANKNSIKIIGNHTDNYCQGYFVYDSKKAGAITVSHLRFGKKPIHSTYCIDRADFVACHQTVFVEKYEMLEMAKDNAVFLLNTQESPEEVFAKLPRKMQEQIIAKHIKLYVIDAYKVAKETGMGVRINTVMQACFFGISGVLPRDEAIGYIKAAIRKSYSKKGEEVVQKNFAAVDASLANLHEVKIPAEATGNITRRPAVPEFAPEFVKHVLGKMISSEGESLKVSDMPADGTFPTATTQYEKRDIAIETPVWDPAKCIQCGKCAMVCPHACIRGKAYDPALLKDAPATFQHTAYKTKEFPGFEYTLQISAQDCTGCGLCVERCPAKEKAITMVNTSHKRAELAKDFDFFMKLPEVDRNQLKINTVKGVQFLRPLFEYSGACAGCGETPYVKLLSQLFGDRAIIANATGCSSIYGGNLPTTPWAKNAEGRGPAWNNSLFEDAAEFGLGYRLTVDKHTGFAKELLKKLEGEIGADLVADILNADQSTEAGIAEQRARVVKLLDKLATIKSDDATQLTTLAGNLVKRSIWSIGGDGWAYDIGYGGLDHVIASGKNINILVLDTGVYSNTGGQCSKATPLGAVAKFATAGKSVPRKDLGMMAMSYGTVYVAQISLGANDAHAIKALLEAESYDGPSLVIAYCHCINQGIDMSQGMKHQELAVQVGAWPLYRYDPRLRYEGKNPLQLDSKEPSKAIGEWASAENRFKSLHKANPAVAAELEGRAQRDINFRQMLYRNLAGLDYSGLKED